MNDEVYTLWLYRRFDASVWSTGDPSQGWDSLSEDDKAYWEHEAAAFHRANVRFNAMAGDTDEQ